ncbi:MAG: glutamate mutase L [Deltaproteobacteria bacterium]|nr:glutamate mutase L [Deltaproteobacteria bacterium]
MRTDHALLVDFGSTFTKIVLVDLEAETVLGRIQTPSTVETDITIGLRRGLDDIGRILGKAPVYRHKLASSSAAGGLRMVAIGLVPDLTVEAAKRAVLGAGAKVVGVYAYRLTENEIEELEKASPDLILLAGGTDGGDRENVIGNATCLGRADLKAPIVFAGNKTAVDEVRKILIAGNKEVVVSENVMPGIGVLQVEQVRSIIRDLFIKRIIDAKGLKNAERFIDSILMPTPTAVLNAARLLAEGTPNEPGIGELVIVDIGGATTDIHSISMGTPTEAGVIPKGLPEPYVKRTVEGDLGMRYNASTIVQAAGKEKFCRQMLGIVSDLDQAVAKLNLKPESLPETEAEQTLDVELARAAASLAMERHAGVIEAAYGPMGQFHIQYGKDLRGIKTVIGTGGPLIFGAEPETILKETLHSEAKPFSLKPKQPGFFIDEKYILYAIGLMAEAYPDKALRIAKKYLRKVE